MKRHAQATESGFFRKLLALVSGAILLTVGFLFSVVILVVIAVVALAVWGYFRWKTRKLRQPMGEPTLYGHVIDGESVVVNEFKEDNEEGWRSVLPRGPPPR